MYVNHVHCIPTSQVANQKCVTLLDLVKSPFQTGTDIPLGNNIELLAVPLYLSREFPGNFHSFFSFWFTFIPELVATATEHIMNSLNNLEHV